MTQTTFSAKEAKNNFGRLLDEARISPVTIKKNNRKVAVLLSVKDYEEAERAIDAYWLARAKQAEKGGFIGVKKSMKLLSDMANA